jgi:hypothetical protein
MLLAIVFFAIPFLGGLHRFYVGKIGTGTLWLLTGGLLFIGQIVDVIMIAAGQFTDKQGRRLQIWVSSDELKSPRQPAKNDIGAKKNDDAGPVAAEAEPTPATAEPRLDEAEGPNERAVDGAEMQPATPSTRSNGGFGFRPRTNPLLGFPGAILLLAAFAVGLGVALGVPHMIASLLPEAGLSEELTDLLGPDWPRLLSRTGYVASVVVMLLATTLLLIARRPAGAAHCIRAVLGAIGLLMTLSALDEALDRVNWVVISGMLNSDQVGPAIEAFLDAARDEQAMVAGFLFVASTLMLAWPPRRSAPPATELRNEGA